VVLTPAWLSPAEFEQTAACILGLPPTSFTMVMSGNADLYSPFPQGMALEEGPQSSEEGSGLHSPIFGAPFPSPHGNSSRHNRYNQDHLDVHRAAGILSSAEFGYNPLLNVQPPLLQHSLEVPDPDAHHHQVSYRSELTLTARNQLGLDFTPHVPTVSRLPPPPAHSVSDDYSFPSASDRSLSGGQSHDPAYFPSGNPSGMPMDANNRLSSTSERVDCSSSPQASPREQRKETSVVVIACRQCRGRKIRCDSTRPICNNCVRRSNECEYDAVPKRRGPDKRPGTRQRSCKKRPSDGSAPPPPSKRKRTISDSQTHHVEPPLRIKEDTTSPKRSLSIHVKSMVCSDDTTGFPSSPPLLPRITAVPKVY
jgi:hypothetical protein